MSKLRRTLGFWFTFTLALGGGLLLGTPVVSAAPVSTVQLTHALQWRSVGPYYGGGVTSVAGVACEPYHFFADLAGAGVWGTADYGVEW